MRETMIAKMTHLLNLYQTHLGLYAEPVDSDLTRFTFVHIDPNDWSRKFQFCVSVATDSFEVTECVPEVEQLEAMQVELNESRDFFGFLKAMRKAFCTLAYNPLLKEERAEQ